RSRRTPDGPAVPVFLLAFQRFLSGADRAQPQGAGLRHHAGAPAARWRRAARAELPRGQSAGPGADPAARTADAAPVDGDPGIPGRDVAVAAAAAGGGTRPP